MFKPQLFSADSRGEKEEEYFRCPPHMGGVIVAIILLVQAEGNTEKEGDIEAYSTAQAGEYFICLAKRPPNGVLWCFMA